MKRALIITAVVLLLVAMIGMVARADYVDPAPEAGESRCLQVMLSDVIPGNWTAVPRVVPLFDFWWGPRLYAVEPTHPTEPMRYSYPGPVIGRRIR